MNATDEVIAGMSAATAAFDLETVFRAKYPRIARAIARVVGDPARAEELAVEVFLKLWRNPQAQGPQTEAWLYRVAVRTGLDELRRRTRRARFENLIGLQPPTPTPEEIHSATEGRQRVREVLASMSSRDSELLVLHSHGLSYEEMALALKLKPASVGTLLSRAQQAFRKSFVRRYGGNHGES